MSEYKLVYDNYNNPIARRYWLTPDNIKNIMAIMPDDANIFNTPADKEVEPDKIHAIVGLVFKTLDSKYKNNYLTFGYSPSLNEDDKLERVNSENNRVCAYITNYNTDIDTEDGNREKPYLQFPVNIANELMYDENGKLLMGGVGGNLGYGNRCNICIIDTVSNQSEHSNLQYVENGKGYIYYTEFSDINDAVWNDSLVPTGEINYNSLGVPQDIGNSRDIANGFYLTANCPVFLTEEAARNYIRYGTINASTCFNDDSYFNDETEKTYYITSQTYQYDKNQVKVSNDANMHTMYIDSGPNVVKGYVNEGDYYNIKLKCYGDSTDEITVRVIDGGSPSTYIMTVSEFNNSSYATNFNTWKDFQYYGRDGFVRGNGFGTNIFLYPNEHDADQSVEHPESYLPINKDDTFDSVNHDDTGVPCNTEDDLISQTHDAATGFITLYEASAGAMAALGSELYTTNQSDWENIKDALKIYGNNPIECIISAYHCPIDLSNFIIKEASAGFMLGSYQASATNVSKVKTYGKIVALGSVLVNPIYGDFRDYDNFQYELHLPFSNPVTLDPKEIMNKTLTIKATVDPYKMQIRYYVIINSVVYKIIDASFGKQIAIIGNDAAGKARELRQDMINLTSQGIGVATSLLTANPAGVANSFMGAANAAYNTLEDSKRDAHKQIVGTFASGCAENDILYPYLTIIETLSIKPTQLEATYGRPCNLITKLGNMRGFTCAELVMLDASIDDAELAELESALSEGIIL